MTADLDVVSTKPSLTPKKHLSFGSTTLTSEGCPVDVVVRDDDYRACTRRWRKLATRVCHARGDPELLAAMNMAAGRDKLWKLPGLSWTEGRRDDGCHDPVDWRSTYVRYATREFDNLVVENL